MKTMMVRIRDQDQDDRDDSDVQPGTDEDDDDHVEASSEVVEKTKEIHNARLSSADVDQQHGIENEPTMENTSSGSQSLVADDISPS